MMTKVSIDHGCNICGIPIDAEYFDESAIKPAPEIGKEVALARFALHPQYCGVLNYFVQFTDQFFKEQTRVETPGLQWRLLMNHRPLFPYHELDRIVNPWGFNCIAVAIRLDENAIVELVVRNVGYRPLAADPNPITRVGGRIVGRYWYNRVYGDVARRLRSS